MWRMIHLVPNLCWDVNSRPHDHQSALITRYLIMASTHLRYLTAQPNGVGSRSCFLPPVWPDLPKFCHLKSFRYFLNLLKFNYRMWQILGHLANLHSCKQPNLEFRQKNYSMVLNKPSGHTAVCTSPSWYLFTKYFQ